ncbi:MAG: hypothetical protein JRI25_27025 [Deltaproteobacteria bacterium]|nr:hypothetical protein [Deltaproteobacteria bacterium]
MRPDAYHFGQRGHVDLVCRAEKPLDDYWVELAWTDEWGDERTHTYGYHEVKAGEMDHHDNAVRGARVTVTAEGYLPNRFTIPGNAYFR